MNPLPYQPPVWLDENRVYGAHGALCGTKPQWEVNGSIYIGPTLVYEVENPYTMDDRRRAEGVLFRLWCSIRAHQTEPTRKNIGYHGTDAHGRHMVTGC